MILLFRMELLGSLTIPGFQALALWRAMAQLRAITDATAISALVNALRALEMCENPRL